MAAPTFTPPAGTVPRGQRVELSTPTPNATIYYKKESTIGSDITWVLFEPGSSITLYYDTRIRAYALRTGLRSSPVVEAVYTMPLDPPPASPQFTNPGGELSNPTQVGISTPSPVPVAICYTINGITPGCNGSSCAAGSLTFSAGSPVPVEASSSGAFVLKAIACGDNRPPSAVTEATYTFRAAAPTANPASGAVPSGQVVAFSTTTVTTGTNAASLCYTTNNTAPTCNEDQCTNGTRIAGSSGNVTVAQDTTYRVVACRAGYAGSEERTFTYDVP